MKSKIIVITLCLLLLCIGVNAQQQYVIKLSDSVTMFSDREGVSEKYITVAEEELQEYIDAGIVEFYEPVMYATYLGEQNWQLENVNAAFPEKIGSLGNGVKVGVIDGGIIAFDAIKDRVLEGYDFHEKTTDVTDKDGHGTFVSSMIALKGSAFAYESYIVPLKVFFHAKDENGDLIYDEQNQPVYTATSTDVANAVIAAVDNFDCSVINLSLSFKSNPTALKSAIDYATGKGVIVVAAAGNDGTATYHYPAAYTNVTGVGSTDEDNLVAFFSQRNDSVHVVAPGLSVVVSPNEQKNNIGSGTSFSAPQVSALGAVAKCINPNITNEQFMSLLQTTSTDLGEEGYDTDYGYGLINCQAFIKKMIEDRKVYISPIKIENGTASSIIYNNTDSLLEAKSVYAESNVPMIIDDVSLETDAVLKKNYNYTSGKVQLMVWDSLNRLVPMGPASLSE